MSLPGDEYPVATDTVTVDIEIATRIRLPHAMDSRSAYRSRFESVIAAVADVATDVERAAWLERVVAHADALGWTAMLDRLGGDPQTAAAPASAKDFVGLARAILDDGMDMAAATDKVAALGLADFDRAALGLFANCSPALKASGEQIIVLRLAAETARDPELAGRLASTLGRAAAGDPSWAARAFDYGLKRVAGLPLPGLQARLYLDLARCLSQSGAADDALTCARAASMHADRAGDDVSADGGAALQAVLLLEKGRPDLAAEIIRPVVLRQRARGIPSGGQDASLVMNACTDGAITQLFERIATLPPEEAVAGFEQALALSGGGVNVYPRETDRRSELAQRLAAGGATNAAVSQMRRVLEEVERTGPPEHTAAIVDWLAAAGGRLMAAGDIDAALNTLSDVERMAAARAPQDDHSAQLRLVYASALQSLGRNGEAKALLIAILADCEALHLKIAEAGAQYVLGALALAERRLVESRQHFDRTSQLAEKAGNVTLLGSSLCRLGVVDASMRQPSNAIVCFERALMLHRKVEYWPGVVVTLIQAAQTYLDLDNIGEARKCADELKTLGAQYPPDDPAWLDFAAARVAAAEGNWQEARELFASALDQADGVRHRLASADARRDWADSRTELYGHAIEAAIVAGASGDAIEFLERGRNRYLRELTAQNGDDGPGWPQLLRTIPPASSAVWFGGFPHGLGVVVASARADGVIEYASRFDPTVTGNDLTEVFQGDMRAVLDAFAANTTVNFIERTVRRGKEVLPGPDTRRQGDGAAWDKSLEVACEFLRDRVWPVILQTIPSSATDLLLAPSVGCSELPYAAAAPDGTPHGGRLSFCTVPSLAALAQSVAPASSNSRSGFTVTQIVNPSEDAALASCIVEAHLVAQAVTGQVIPLRGRRATRKRVLDALATSDVVHFMGHAFVDWQDPMQSGLVCASGKETVGTVTVDDVVKSIGRIHTRLVVLSACQIGYVRAGDRQNDFVGLPAALIAVGARTVVAPRWAVDDLPTGMFISTLLRAWLWDGVPLPRALTQSRRWLRDEVTMAAVASWIDAAGGDPAVDRDTLAARRAAYAERTGPTDRPFTHVRHWGAFEIIGNPAP